MAGAVLEPLVVVRDLVTPEIAAAFPDSEAPSAPAPLCAATLAISVFDGMRGGDVRSPWVDIRTVRCVLASGHKGEHVSQTTVWTNSRRWADGIRAFHEADKNRPQGRFCWGDDREHRHFRSRILEGTRLSTVRRVQPTSDVERLLAEVFGKGRPGTE